MSKKLYHNTEKLISFIFKREKIRILVWIIIITGITILVASAYTELFTSQQEISTFAQTMRNPAMTAMVGPGYGLDDYTVGAMMAHQMLLFTAIAVGIMSIFLVVRHTRRDEESGRIEMVRSLPVGRLANLVSTIFVSLIINIFLALIVGLGLYILRIESIGLEGSLLYGAVLGVTGIFFTATTALFVQLSENTQRVIGYSFGFLGIAYLIRAVGDVSSETLSWFSPLSWILRTQVYVNNYWGPLLITIGAAGIIMAAAFYLNSIRDLEAGLVPTKSGSKTASAFLKSSFGLAFRLQRTAIISWMVGLFILGLSYGSVLGDVDAFLESIDFYKEVFIIAEGFSLAEQFLATLMSIISIISTIPALIFIFKLKREEFKNRTENIYARAVSRTRLMSSYLLISFISSLVMLSLAALGLWSAGAVVMEEPLSFKTVFNSALVYLPAIWVMIGLAISTIGYIPHRTILTWFYLGYSFFVVYLGDLIQVPNWMVRISPFGNIPQIPIEGINYSKILLLTAIAGGLIITGFIGYNRRDIEG
ncbi:MAG: hypothetical protein R6V14_02610 [Halanaerobiales bacterium]